MSSLSTHKIALWSNSSVSGRLNLVSRRTFEPILLCCRWYFGKIKRIEAEKKLLLPENEHGAFLIRDSESRRNDFSLSGKPLTKRYAN